MLDLIVAKAMAKLLEDRYQSIKELGDDLREVRRQLDSSRPAAALKASNAPAMAKKSAPIVERHVDTATMPLGAGRDERTKDDDKPVPLAKTFDSFDATLRLAAMTDQTDDFREYITQTQKMRAYRGKIEGPLAAKIAEQVAPPPPKPVPEPRPITPLPVRPAPAPVREVLASEPGQGTNLIVVAAIVVLAVAAVALTVALLVM
jgi:serine/threonine-protein kinase